MAEYLTSHNLSLQQRLQQLALKHGLNQMQISPLQSPLTIEFYEQWLGRHYHGDMLYLETHLPQKKDPRNAHPHMRSVISISQPYFPVINKNPSHPAARVALYAHQADYHHWLKEKLQRIILELGADFPAEVFTPYVDSGPLLERELGRQNALGWFGKNTCLINPKSGSLFFLAEILTSLDSQNEIELAPVPDFCGQCTRCLDICPTGALISPRNLKADQCISYYTIEAKTIPPAENRKKIGDWFFGCDLCQTACPWNEKVFRRQKDVDTSEISTAQTLSLTDKKKSELADYFRFLLTASHRQIQRHHFGSPLLRAGAKGLKRNALIVIANRRMTELRKEIEPLLTVEYFAELAAWTLKELDRSVDEKAQ